MKYTVVVAVALAMSAPALAFQQAAYYVMCNHSGHGVVRGGPFSRIGAAYTYRQCEKARMSHISSHPKNARNNDGRELIVNCSSRAVMPNSLN